MFPFARPLMAIAAVALASFAGGILRADVLTLANGDKLKGKLVRNADGLITFKSDILGEITVPATKASVTLDPPPPAAPVAPAAPPAPVAPAAPVARATGSVTAQTNAEKPKHKRKIRLTPFTTLDPRTAANDPARATKVEDTGWFNRVDFGLASQSGRAKSVSIDLRAENDYRTPRTDTRFFNRYLYGKTEGVVSANAISSNLRFRRTLTGRLFLQSNTRYDHNTITLTQCDAEQGAGMGVNLMSTPALVLATGADAAARYRSYLPPKSGAPAAPSATSCVLNVFQDMLLKFNQRFTITQNFLAVVAPTNNNDYRLNFNAALTSKLTDAFNITARVELEYDRTLPPELRYNQRITTSLGFMF